MNNPTTPSKIGFLRKGDLILITVLILVSCLLLLIRPFHTPGTSVTVTVDGNYYGSWELSTDIDIIIPGFSGTNTLHIRNGLASITAADCPDKLCVHHTPISGSGERIVCLPNRVIVSVDSKNSSPGTDAVSQ